MSGHFLSRLSKEERKLQDEEKKKEKERKKLEKEREKEKKRKDEIRMKNRAKGIKVFKVGDLWFSFVLPESNIRKSLLILVTNLIPHLWLSLALFSLLLRNVKVK